MMVNGTVYLYKKDTYGFCKILQDSCVFKTAGCAFDICGCQPELWWSLVGPYKMGSKEPVSGNRNHLTSQKNTKTH